jgi:hypothetical protein
MDIRRKVDVVAAQELQNEHHGRKLIPFYFGKKHEFGTMIFT